MSTQDPNDKSDLMGNIALLLIIVALVFFSPGIFLIGLANLKLPLFFDTGQLWTFSIVTALGLYAVIAFLRKSAKEGLKTYILLCFGIIFIILLFIFGFKAEWPVQLLVGFFPTN